MDTQHPSPEVVRERVVETYTAGMVDERAVIGIQGVSAENYEQLLRQVSVDRPAGEIENEFRDKAERLREVVYAINAFDGIAEAASQRGMEGLLELAAKAAAGDEASHQTLQAIKLSHINRAAECDDIADTIDKHGSAHEALGRLTDKAVPMMPVSFEVTVIPSDGDTMLPAQPEPEIVDQPAPVNPLLEVATDSTAVVEYADGAAQTDNNVTQISQLYDQEVQEAGPHPLTREEEWTKTLALIEQHEPHISRVVDRINGEGWVKKLWHELKAESGYEDPYKLLERISRAGVRVRATIERIHTLGIDPNDKDAIDLLEFASLSDECGKAYLVACAEAGFPIPPDEDESITYEAQHAIGE